MTQGIHHITAIASNAKDTISFYTNVLGLRLVKKTVNQDDTQTYHLFFGDTLGHPGMDLTFFIFLPASQGKRGNGLVTTISLAVPESSLAFWQERFEKLQVQYQPIHSRFEYQRLPFFDSDQQHLELVGIPGSELDQASDPWITKEVPKEYAIRHFHSATLSVTGLSRIEPILSHVFGYEKQESQGNIHRYSLPKQTRAHELEVVEDQNRDFGVQAAGTVHHIAFRAKDENEQAHMRERVIELGLYPTEVINRFYFKSVYFRTPAGILFEIATDGPGFTADEREEDLGKHLALPPFLEQKREAIEVNLLPLE